MIKKGKGLGKIEGRNKDTERYRDTETKRQSRQQKFRAKPGDPTSI
jgi:hypothetical protein